MSSTEGWRNATMVPVTQEMLDDHLNIGEMLTDRLLHPEKYPPPPPPPKRSRLRLWLAQVFLGWYIKLDPEGYDQLTEE